MIGTIDDVIISAITKFWGKCLLAKGGFRLAKGGSFIFYSLSQGVVEFITVSSLSP